MTSIASSIHAPSSSGVPQNAMSNTHEPVNGKPASATSMGPAIINSSANGAPTHNDHSRKPSSVTISAQGTSGSLPNGNAVAANARPNISFGNFDNASSPAPSHSQPHTSQTSLSGSMHNPAHRSPSPIPPKVPTESGGRPPSSLSGAGALNFGSLPGADGTDGNGRPGAPQAPAFPAHLRRGSSQSQHSDMSPSVPRFTPNGRGRGYNPPHFNAQNGPGSPANRPGYMANRTPSNNPAYPAQMPMRGPQGSPYTQNRSPAMPPAPMHGQGYYAGGAPMGAQYGGYYPQGFNPQAQSQGLYGVPQQLDPNYSNAMYYQQGYMQPGMPYAPASPRPHQQSQGSYMQPYNGGGQSMSRTSSQNPERPTSALSQQQPGQTPTTGSVSPAPQAPAVQRPAKRASAAIAIKRPDGTELTFDKKPAAPAAAAQPKAAIVISSASGTPSSSTPPPRAAATTPSNAHVKTAEEKKAEFIESMKKITQGESADKPAEVAKEEAKPAEPVQDKVAAAEEKAEPEAEQSVLKADAGDDEEAKKAAEEAEKKRLADEEEERWIAELEAQEREEEEREKAYQEKKAAEKAAAAAKAGPTDEELKAAEREAEAREAAKAAGEGADSEGAALFAKLKKATIGPGAEADDSEASTPAPASPDVAPVDAVKKPAPPKGLKIETNKPSEPLQPTPGMLSLEKAKVADGSISYPDGVNAPSSDLQGRRYDLAFLLQFQTVFKEKPSISWDKTLKETVGDTSDSARPQSARTPSMAGGRQASRGGNAAPMGMGPMGTFVSGGRTLPAGTTSEQRFRASGAGAMPPNPFASFGRGAPGAFPMGAPMMARNPSSQSLAQQGGMGGRQASARGKGSRRGGPSAAEEAKLAKSMPLTAGQDLKGLEVSKTGWKPMSIVGGGKADAPLPGGHMAPDVVQRKVKSSLNKMTPEKFEKISDDILVIAGQSKDEQDGRTLRQVIQLTFEKACDEAHWASMYARFCKRMLETMSTEIKDENVRDKAGQPVVGGALFRKYLLNRCQEEFERGWEANLPEKPEGEAQSAEAAMLSDEYYVAAAAKRRGLGLIQFIGELYKLDMLTIRIMHECVVRLLNFEGLPDESAVESLTKLLRTVGGKMEAAPNGTAMIDTYFQRIDMLMKMEGLPSRLYYMLLDMTELRKKQWKSKDDQKGPKTIQEIHQDAINAQAAAEVARAKNAGPHGGRPPIGRGDARSFSQGGMPPPDYPRNTVGMDDLKRLAQRGSRTQSSGGPSLGPASMLGSRSSSGRRGLGPLSRGNEDSAASSRTGTPPVKETPTAGANAFAALAALDGSGDAENTADDVASPVNSPPTAKATPAVAIDETIAEKPVEEAKAEE